MVACRNNTNWKNSTRTITVFLIISGIYSEQKDPKMKYILHWTDNKELDEMLGKDSHSFILRGCHHRNCFVTNNRSYLDDVCMFDAILFEAESLRKNPNMKLPQERSGYQKYVLVSRKSAAVNPVSDRYNGFFNWTWTYRLDSDVSFSYVVIKNRFGKVVGPENQVKWLRKMTNTSGKVLGRLWYKKKAAAWFSSECGAESQRDSYIAKLKEELENLGQDLDVFGECGRKRKSCSGIQVHRCYSMLRRKYFFYLSFESSLSTDFVSDSLLIALKNYAVPIVLGGANYSRFLPDGSYLDALDLSPEELAAKMNEIIQDPTIYNDMFKWHNHYSYHYPEEDSKTDRICGLCAALNRNQGWRTKKVYRNIVKWFNERKDWFMIHPLPKYYLDDVVTNVPQVFLDYGLEKPSSDNSEDQGRVVSSGIWMNFFKWLKLLR